MRVVGAVLVVLVAATAAAAQTVSVQATPAPHYAGEPIEIHVVVKGFDEDPAPPVVGRFAAARKTDQRAVCIRA